MRRRVGWQVGGLLVIAVAIGCGDNASATLSDGGPASDAAAIDGGGGDGGSGDSGAPACDPGVTPMPNPTLVETPGDEGCPAGMARIEAYCIDRHESALVVLETSLPWSPMVNPGDTAVRAVSVADAIPQAYMSGGQAQAACEAAGKRLCSDEEWLRACRGPEDRAYPYGTEVVEGACNDARDVHPAVELFGADLGDWDLTSRCLDQLPDTVAATGASSACVTSEGVFDLVGNLSEWVANPDGTTRGGTFLDTQLSGAGCAYLTTAHTFEYWDFLTGFRCCASSIAP